MRTRIPLVVLCLVLTISAELARAENWLQGQVLENHEGTKKPAVGAQVWIVNVGNPYFTQSDGGYRVLVPDAYRVGQTIVLFVKRKGWAIATPVGGKIQLSKEFTSDILLLPESSSEFLSPAQLDKLIESLPEKLKSQVKPDGKEGEPDPTQVVREYATDHGIPEGEVSTKVEALIKQYEQSSDLEKQCLASIYRKNLKQAATRCEQSATSKVDLLKKKRQEVESLSKTQLKSDRSVGPSFAQRFGEIIRVTTPSKLLRFDTEPQDSHDMLFVVAPSGKATPAQLEEAKRQLIKLTEEVVREFRATGDTYYANYQFDEALKAYKQGLSYVDKKDLPTLWADMQWIIGIANRQMGIRTKDAAIQEHLSEAVHRYHEAQSVYVKREFPEAWAAIENNLGTVLANQGTRTGGETGTRLLAQAVEAYRAALTVYTKDALPQDWAATQNNLGNVLANQGTRTSGEAGTRLLAQAVEAYRAALTVYTKDQLPQNWAATQNNLGIVLANQGTRTGGETGTRLLAQAVEAYRAALTVYTKDQLPQNWAATQNNLGLVLWNQGTRTGGKGGTQLLAQAVEAYRAALTVYTKEALPQQWAMTQNNLGTVLQEQGTRTGGEADTRLLAQAVEAYRAALTVRTKDALPQDWAMTQNNLGNVLANQGTRTGGEAGTRLLAQAVEAYRAALTVSTKDALPQDWAATQNNLGNVLADQGTRTGGETGTRLLAQAVEAYRAALTVYTKDQLPQNWAATQNNLGLVLWNQGTRTGGKGGTQLLAQAVEAYRAALTVYTKEALPQQWAMTQNNLGTVLQEQGTRTGGEADTRLLAQAVEAYRAALTVYTKEALPQQWAMTQNNLAKASLAREDWPTAAESSRNVLTLYPDYAEAYQRAHFAYHEKLFAYASAFEVTNLWLDRHPEDVPAQANFAEAHLTTGRYAEAERRLEALLKKPDLDSAGSVGLRIVQIVNTLALKNASTVPQKLHALRTFVSEQPETFHAGWSFDGTRHYARSEQIFTLYRPWLMDLFAVVEAKDRAALLAALDRVQAGFKP